MKTQTIFIFMAIALSTASVSCIRTKNKSASTIGEKDSVRLLKPYKPFSTFKGDTLKYLRYNFIDRKNEYIGKTLNDLLKDSELEVKLWLGSGDFSNRFLATKINLKFDDELTYDKKSNINFKEGFPPTNLPMQIYGIEIVWQEPVSMEMDGNLFRQSQGIWNKAVLDYYGPRIIKSITVYQGGGAAYNSDQ